MMSKKLVAYFSASGVTAQMAKTLAEAVGGELFEIVPKVPYTQADLNWMDKISKSTISGICRVGSAPIFVRPQLTTP